MDDFSGGLIEAAGGAVFFFGLGVYVFFFLTPQEKERRRHFESQEDGWSKFELLFVRDNLIVNRIVGFLVMLFGCGMAVLIVWLALQGPAASTR